DKLTVGGWRRSVREIGTLVDNTFRVLVFQDAVKRGMSLDAAASLARRVALDYSDLSVMEKEFLRHAVTFYAYSRRNFASFIQTLLRNPNRLTSQIRLTRGLYKLLYDEDEALLANDYTRSRLALHPSFSQLWKDEPLANVMWLPPMQPAMDGFNLMALFASLGMHETNTDLYGHLNMAALAAVSLVVFEIEDFNNLPADYLSSNIVPEWFRVADWSLTGGWGRRVFDIQQHTTLDPWDAAAASGEEIHVAHNWRAWQSFKTVLTMSRAMNELADKDRSNIGQGTVKVLTSLLGMGPEGEGLENYGAMEIPPYLALTARALLGEDIDWGSPEALMLLSGMAQPRPGVGAAGEAFGSATGIRARRIPDAETLETYHNMKVNQALEYRNKRLETKPK
ncbi:MAG: hypothetical protein ABIL09_05225, partial [Gemmatimonadota bacterium]